MHMIPVLYQNFRSVTQEKVTCGRPKGLYVQARNSTALINTP